MAFIKCKGQDRGLFMAEMNHLSSIHGDLLLNMLCTMYFVIKKNPREHFIKSSLYNLGWSWNICFFQTDCIPFISEMSCHVTFVTVDLESRMLFLGISWASMDQFWCKRYQNKAHVKCKHIPFGILSVDGTIVALFRGKGWNVKSDGFYFLKMAITQPFFIYTLQNFVKW